MAPQPRICKPLQAPVEERAKQKQSECSKRTKRRKLTCLEEVCCQWPGCASKLAERRLDSDLQPYTHEAFVERHAPGTGVTVRWDRAPRAATYCAQHMGIRREVLLKLGIPATDAGRMATSGWLHLHPEADVATISAVRKWFAASKLLYALEHPHKIVGDQAFEVSRVYCCSNKVSKYVGQNGKYCANRWTYDPLNRDGNMASNRRLLVHGAPFDKVDAILDNDLKMSGVEVESSTGKMLGEGLYVADSFMKSLQYATPGLCNGNESKLVFVVEVNVGKPLVCKSVLRNKVSRKFERTYEEANGGSTREDITTARGKRYFLDSAMLRSGWAKGCRVPGAASTEPSLTACSRDTGPLKFNEWCVHNTQLYSLAYIIQFEKPPKSDRMPLPAAPSSTVGAGCVIA